MQFRMATQYLRQTFALFMVSLLAFTLCVGVRRYLKFAGKLARSPSGSCLITSRIEIPLVRWFEVETNYDHWVPPPQSDDRRDPANKAMKAMGQTSISVQSLFNVMSTHPVLNHKTTYTVVFSAAKPELMQSWIRV